jgi:hypothetical protein
MRLRPNSGQPAAGVGRARAGGGLWVSLARFSVLVGVEGGRRARTAEPSGGGRGSHYSGETQVNAGQPVVVVALVNARGGVGMVARPRELVGTRLGGGGHGGRRRHAQARSGGPL